MISKEKLKEYAAKLMFEMKEEEYETLQLEFEVLLKQIAIIETIDGLKDVTPMTFPFENSNVSFREDINEESLSVEEVIKNAKYAYADQIKVPKVVD